MLLLLGTQIIEVTKHNGSHKPQPQAYTEAVPWAFTLELMNEQTAGFKRITKHSHVLPNNSSLFGVKAIKGTIGPTAALELALPPAPAMMSVPNLMKDQESKTVSTTK